MRIFLSIISLLFILAHAEQVETKEQVQVEAKEQIEDKKSDETAKEQAKDPQKLGQFVLGVMLGAHTFKVDNEYYRNFIEIDGVDNSKLNFGFSEGVKIGYDFMFMPKHRLKLYADYIAAHFDGVRGGSIIQTGALNLDYQFNLTKMLGFFVGASMGMSFLDTKDLGSQVGFSIGGNAGISLSLLSWLELEFRLRVMSDAFVDKIAPNVDSVGTLVGATRQSVDFGDLMNFSVGLNFRF